MGADHVEWRRDVLAAAERKLGVAEKLAAVICDPRDPLRVVHLLPDILRARIFASRCAKDQAATHAYRKSTAKSAPRCTLAPCEEYHFPNRQSFTCLRFED
jgi:hypothetical protein